MRTALEQLDREGTLRNIAQLSLELSAVLDAALAEAGEHPAWLAQLKQRISEVSDRATARMASHENLARTCLELSDAEFDFLFDEARQLLAIGFNVAEHRRDTSFYDLLASEARLASFVAIAQGQLRQEHWFALGRLLTGVDGSPTLLSWSGSMFEYLMPLLVMPTFDDTLLDQTCKGAVARQIAYGDSRKVPWGMSESGYNLTDVHLNYQYRAFGVPGLGFKRGPGRRSRGCAVRLADGIDGCSQVGVRQSATDGRRRSGRQIRLLRSHRLHAGATDAAVNPLPSCVRSWLITKG